MKKISKIKLKKTIEILSIINNNEIILSNKPIEESISIAAIFFIKNSNIYRLEYIYYPYFEVSDSVIKLSEYFSNKYKDKSFFIEYLKNKN